ncbi:hypothetical protein AABD61_08355 [Edwardsiella piscicida]|uniref:hypothetical protein n=1 Tax=Edwardsiella piscicida TaxID=1263550 RepID=UPI00370D4C90
MKHNVLKFCEFTCYHGTTYDAMLSIMQHGFKFSQSNEDWLGHGVYFFIDGISDPIKNAREWAENNNKKNKKTCVIKAKVKISIADVLDIRTIDGLKIYNFYRDAVIDCYYSKLEKRRILA